MQQRYKVLYVTTLIFTYPFSGITDDDQSVFSGPCKGDGGGPILVEKNESKKIFGIISGGLGCGEGYPGWYTKVSRLRCHDS